MGKLGTGLAAVWALILLNAPSAEAQVKNFMNQSPSVDEMINALTPKGPPSATRGLSIAVPEEQAGIAVDIKFNWNSAELSPEAQGVLKKIAEALHSSELEPYRFRIEGHTDSTGRPDYNLRLSERRASAVRKYLVMNFSIPARRFDVVGKGMSEPLDASHPESGVNRRVQFVTLGSDQ
jgi:outer membrane protein OmpA-like peptidoglycan-associated protein